MSKLVKIEILVKFKFGSCKNPANLYSRVQIFVETGKLASENCGFKDKIIKNFQAFDEWVENLNC